MICKKLCNFDKLRKKIGQFEVILDISYSRECAINDTQRLNMMIDSRIVWNPSNDLNEFISERFRSRGETAAIAEILFGRMSLSAEELGRLYTVQAADDDNPSGKFYISVNRIQFLAAEFQHIMKTQFGNRSTSASSSITPSVSSSIISSATKNVEVPANDKRVSSPSLKFYLTERDDALQIYFSPHFRLAFSKEGKPLTRKEMDDAVTDIKAIFLEYADEKTCLKARGLQAATWVARNDLAHILNRFPPPGCRFQLEPMKDGGYSLHVGEVEYVLTERIMQLLVFILTPAREAREKTEKKASHPPAHDAISYASSSAPSKKPSKRKR